MTAILDRLARRGWIRRVVSEVDRRSFVVELTRDGRGAARDLQRRLAALDRAIRRELPRRELVALAGLPSRVGALARPGSP